MKKHAFLAGLIAGLIAGLLLFAIPAVSMADELVLVKQSAGPAPIVVFEDAPPITRQAADELAEYIEKISGARPKVIEGKPNPLPESAIWFGYQPVLPDLSIAQTIVDLKLVAESGCLGIFIDTVWEHWATQGSQYYVMVHLVWNADQDGQALLEDYYRRGFGPAVEEVQAYYEMLEEARMAFVDEHGYGVGLFYFPLLYTNGLLDDARERLEQAARKVENEDPIYGQRVAFVQAGLDHTRLVVENCRLMAAYWKDKDEAIAEKARANWERIQSIAEQHPYAVNWGPIRPHTPRMSLLNPNGPEPRRRPSIPEDLDLE